MRRYGSPQRGRSIAPSIPDAYRPRQAPLRWDLSYLGTYSDDRQPTLERLLIEPARRAPHLRFAVAGPQYPATSTGPPTSSASSMSRPPTIRPSISASRFTLNVTRADMIAAGYSPSVRLFEAAACAAPILSDDWAGLDSCSSRVGKFFCLRTLRQC